MTLSPKALTPVSMLCSFLSNDNAGLNLADEFANPYWPMPHAAPTLTYE